MALKLDLRGLRSDPNPVAFYGVVAANVLGEKRIFQHKRVQTRFYEGFSFAVQTPVTKQTKKMDPQETLIIQIV